MIDNEPSLASIIGATDANKEIADDQLGIDILKGPKGAAILRSFEAAAKGGIDELTGLENTIGLNREIELLMERLNRGNQIEDTPHIAAFKPDIRRFKAFNDLFGWSIGDECLARLGRNFKGLRITDLKGRLGGDDFAVIAPLMTQDGKRIIWDIVSRLKQIGDRTSLEMFQQYGDKFNQMVSQSRGQVLRALRLPDNYDGDMSWHGLGIATLAIPARLMVTGQLLAKYQQVKKDNPNKDNLEKPINWWAELFATEMDAAAKETKDLIDRGESGHSVCNWDQTSEEAS